MGNYINAGDVWDFLNSYSRIYTETAGTADGSTTNFSLDNKNVISTSVSVYTDGSSITTGYSVNYDKGELDFDSAPDSGSVVTADYFYSSMPNSVVNKFIDQTENKINQKSKRTQFNLSTGNTEYHDVEKRQKTFFTKYCPIRTASVYRNRNHPCSTPDWQELDEGLGNDYLLDDENKEVGRIEFIDNFPGKGKNKLKIEYSYGYSSGAIPDYVKELATLETAKKIIDSTVFNAYESGQEGFSPARLDQIDDRVIELRNFIKKEEISLI